MVIVLLANTAEDNVGPAKLGRKGAELIHTVSCLDTKAIVVEIVGLVIVLVVGCVVCKGDTFFKIVSHGHVAGLFTATFTFISKVAIRIVQEGHVRVDVNEEVNLLAGDADRQLDRTHVLVVRLVCSQRGIVSILIIRRGSNLLQSYRR